MKKNLKTLMLILFLGYAAYAVADKHCGFHYTPMHAGGADVP
jgi:hypothetical protein